MPVSPVRKFQTSHRKIGCPLKTKISYRLLLLLLLTKNINKRQLDQCTDRIKSHAKALERASSSSELCEWKKHQAG
jgi:hypothetical protein